MDLKVVSRCCEAAQCRIRSRARTSPYSEETLVAPVVPPRILNYPVFHAVFYNCWEGGKGRRGKKVFK